MVQEDDRGDPRSGDDIQDDGAASAPTSGSKDAEVDDAASAPTSGSGDAQVDDAASAPTSGSGDAHDDDAATASASGSGDAHDDDAVSGSGDTVSLGVPREEQWNDDQEAVVTCATTAGPVVMRLHRSWSPNGYDRAASLFERGFFDRSHFFRVAPHFLVQFGLSYTKDAALARFASTAIQDDPKRKEQGKFQEGMISFAGSGPNSRTSQLFIAYDGAGNLGSSPWETSFGEVVEGMENIRNLYSGYGDMPPWGKGPEQGPIRNQGSRYIEENFPLLDKFETCTVKRMASSPHGGVSTSGHGKAKDKVAKGKQRLRATRDAMEEMADAPSPLLWALVLVSVLGALYQILVRGKKSKQAGKTN